MSSLKMLNEDTISAVSKVMLEMLLWPSVWTILTTSFSSSNLSALWLSPGSLFTNYSKSSSIHLCTFCQTEGMGRHCSFFLICQSKKACDGQIHPYLMILVLSRLSSLLWSLAVSRIRQTLEEQSCFIPTVSVTGFIPLKSGIRIISIQSQLGAVDSFKPLIA